MPDPHYAATGGEAHVPRLPAGWRALAPEEVVLGQPLAHDVHDATGRLLLKAGHVITTESLRDRVLQTGPCVRLPDEARAAAAPVAARPPPALRTRSRVRVFNVLEDARVSLSRSLDAGLSLDALEEAARGVLHAVDLDADAALAFATVGSPTAYAVRHAVDCAVLCECLGRQMGWDEPHRMALAGAALSMNAAMADLQDELVHQAAPLDERQRAAVVAHPRAAERLLRAAGVTDERWLAAVAHHHEAFDGSGYPDGLAGAAIPPEAQLLYAADNYLAMVADRSYRSGKDGGGALRQMLLDRGRGLDPQVAARLLRELGVYPPGSLVALSNGEIAVVIRRGLTAQAPVVRSVRSASGVRLPAAPKRLTSKPPTTVARAETMQVLGDMPMDLPALWETTVVVDVQEGGAGA